MQALGVLAAIALVRSLVGPDREGRATPAVLAVVAIAAFSSTLVPVVSEGLTLARANNARTEYESIVAGGQASDPSIDVGFVEWTRGRVPRGSRYRVAPLQPATQYGLNWLSYRMLPGRPVRPGERPDLLVLWGPDAVKSYDRRSFGPPELYAPGLGIARRRL